MKKTDDGHQKIGNRKQSKSRQGFSFGRVLLAIIVLLFVGGAAYYGWEFYWVSRELSRIETQEQQLLEEKKQLEAEKERYNDPKHIEEEARNQLGLVKDNEVPYIR